MHLLWIWPDHLLWNDRVLFHFRLENISRIAHCPTFLVVLLFYSSVGWSPNANLDFIDSQNSWDLKGSLRVIYSNLLLKVGPVRSGCSGPCPAELWISPNLEIPQLPWSLFYVWLPWPWVFFSYYLVRISPVATCVHCLLPPHCAIPRGISLSPLLNSGKHVFIDIQERLELFTVLDVLMHGC